MYQNIDDDMIISTGWCMFFSSYLHYFIEYCHQCDQQLYLFIETIGFDH